jgi:hypothetical protein
MTCCRRLRGLQAEEIWDLIHFALLDWLSGVSRLDWSKVMLDSCSCERFLGAVQRPEPHRSRALQFTKAILGSWYAYWQSCCNHRL